MNELVAEYWTGKEKTKMGNSKSEERVGFEQRVSGQSLEFELVDIKYKSEMESRVRKSE